MTTPDFEPLYSQDEAIMLADAHRAITHCNLWDWMKTYTPEENKGFMFAHHPNLDRIEKAMFYSGHSGSSYGWTMRIMEDIAKHGWDDHKNRVRGARSSRQLNEWASQQPRKPAGNPCPCRRARGLTDGWCGVAGFGVPACDH